MPKVEQQVPFSKIRKGSRFVYHNTSFTKVSKTQGVDHGGVKVTLDPTELVGPPPKRKNKTERWSDACQEARDALDAAMALKEEEEAAQTEEGTNDEPSDKLKELLGKLEDAMSELESLRSEYAEPYDNMPEQLQSSPYGEKLSAMNDATFEVTISGPDDLEEAESLIDEAEGMEVPLGFGRD